MESKTLAEVVIERPFPEYGQWWRMGREFLDFMSTAIVGEWAALPGHGGDLAAVNAHVQEYVQTVFGRTARSGLVDDFVQKRHAQPIQSGEFDALSYAFYRSAFEIMAQNINQYAQPLAREQRYFTQRVGRIFYHSFTIIWRCLRSRSSANAGPICRVADRHYHQMVQFLVAQGYCAITFALHV
ncbi:MAG: hypothetical protein R2911_39685 [Caldilineaceae bacterium]